MNRQFFYVLGFSLFCLFKSKVAGALPPHGMVRLDFLDNPAPFDLPKKWNSYSLPGNPESLVISTNLTSSIALDPASISAFEKKFPQIPGDEIKRFVDEIFSKLREKNAQKCMRNLVFDNIPWEQISFKDFLPLLKKIKNFKNIEFRQTVVEPGLLKDLLSHSNTLKSLSFSSCFMRHNFLKEIEAYSPKLKKLSLSQVGFFEEPRDNSPADSIPFWLTELSLSSCYRAVCLPYLSGKGKVASHLIQKIGNFVGVPWLAKRSFEFPNLERLTVREPEVYLENMASYPVDKIFELAPRLSFLELGSCYHCDWYAKKEGEVDELDHLTLAQKFKKGLSSFLSGSSSVLWEKGANSLTFETDGAFFSKRGSRPKVSLARNGFFDLSKELLGEKTTKNFESLIEKFGKISLIKLNGEDFPASKIKKYLEGKKIKVELAGLTPDPLPDYVIMTCSMRVQVGFNVFDRNQKQKLAVYSPDLCKRVVSKYNLSEQEVKKKFEDGTVNELFKSDFRNVENLAQYLIKKLSLFLFTAEELRGAQERLGYYPVSNLAHPYHMLFEDLKTYLYNSEIPIEFMELFSSDFDKLPPSFDDFTRNYLIKRENYNRRLLGLPPMGGINPTLLHHLAVAHLFPSPCQLIPLLKVQERAKRVACAILGLEEFEGECLED